MNTFEFRRSTHYMRKGMPPMAAVSVDIKRLSSSEDPLL